MPCVLDGVILLEKILPNGESIGRPPAIGRPPGAVWQATQSAAVAR
jgi:hypothetical protein